MIRQITGISVSGVVGQNRTFLVVAPTLQYFLNTGIKTAPFSASLLAMSETFVLQQVLLLLLTFSVEHLTGFIGAFTTLLIMEFYVLCLPLAVFGVFRFFNTYMFLTFILHFIVQFQLSVFLLQATLGAFRRQEG